MRMSRTSSLTQSHPACRVYGLFIEAYQKRGPCLICILHMQQSHTAIVSLCGWTERREEFSGFEHVVCFYLIALYGQIWTRPSQANLFHVSEGLDSTLTRSYKSSAMDCRTTVFPIMCNWIDSVLKMGNDRTHTHTHTHRAYPLCNLFTRTADTRAHVILLTPI